MRIAHFGQQRKLYYSSHWWAAKVQRIWRKHKSRQSHGGESCEFKTTTMADTIKNNVDSGKTFFAISVKTGQICVGSEEDTPEK